MRPGWRGTCLCGCRGVRGLCSDFGSLRGRTQPSFQTGKMKTGLAADSQPQKCQIPALPSYLPSFFCKVLAGQQGPSEIARISPSLKQILCFCGHAVASRELVILFPKDKMVFVNHRFIGLVEEGICAGRVFGFSLLQVRATATTSQALSALGEQISASCWQITQVWGSVMGVRCQTTACLEEQGTKHCGGVPCCLASPVIHKDAFSQNHRVFWVGRELKDHLVLTALPRAGTPFARPGCSKLYPTWLG